MTWLKLTKTALYLMEGDRKNLDSVPTEALDSDTLALDVPLHWLRSDDAPTQMIISLAIPPKNNEPIGHKPDDSAMIWDNEKENNLRKETDPIFERRLL